MANRTRVRAIKIVIDIPESESDPWIMMPIQKVYVDENDEIVQTVDRVDQVYRKVPEVALEMVQAPDPVTQELHTVSIAGLGALITVTAAKFMAEDFNGTIDENALVWIDE